MMTDDEIETAARAIATRRNLSHPTVEQWDTVLRRCASGSRISGGSRRY